MTKNPKVIWKQLTIRVPVEVHRALKVRAAEEGRSMAVIIEGLVRGYLPAARYATDSMKGLAEAFPEARVVGFPGGTLQTMGAMLADGQSLKRVVGKRAMAQRSAGEAATG